MNLQLLLLLEGFAYIVVFGGLSLLRREGLSMRFALEAVVLTLMVSGYSFLTDFPFHPVLFLVLLYLVTMRVRLLVEVGNYFAKRGQFTRAGHLYDFALRLWPDQSGRLIIQVNQGTALLQSGQLDQAVAALKEVLKQADQGYLGVKYESAAHYNLGVAYLRKKLEAQAVVEFNAVLDTWPASEYSRRAIAALEKHRQKSKASTSKEST